MTPEQVQGIKDIEGTSGYRAILGVIESTIERLKDVTLIDQDKPNIEAKTIGRILAVEMCKELRDEISLSNPLNKEIKRTYE